MQSEELDFNITFENVEILGTTVTNRNYIHDDVMSRLNWGNAGHQWVQSLISSPLTPKKKLTIKILVQKIIALLAHFNSLKLEEGRKLGKVNW
jgi:hypothetical protein